MSGLGKLRYLQSLLISKKVNRKIVVIESDDWGSERIPNLEVRHKLQEGGINIHANPHIKYDTLERYEDLIALEELLENIQLRFKKKVVLTTNFVTSNPDYDKIKKDNFNLYYHETFINTYFKRDGDNRIIEKIKDLSKAGFIRPQLHGREHINAQLWLSELKNGNDLYLKAFYLGCYGIDNNDAKSHRKNLMAALEFQNEYQKKFVIDSLKEAQFLFNKIFGYSSKTFIAPRYVWDQSLESCFSELGITHLQTSVYQKSPSLNKYSNIFHYTGQLNRNSGICYIVRNNFFEPAYSKQDWVKLCLKKVDLAFKFRTPAIICMHRINFVGALDPQNRNLSLNLFNQLLESIIVNYPDVEFLSSEDLARLI